jgi:sRNA-binding protein
MRRITIGLAVATALTMFGASTFVYAQTKVPDSVVLKGAPMGGVKLEHAKHAKEYGAKCTDCHHASKPEKAMTAAQQKCTDCHTKTATAPMKTKLQAAFHDPTAKAGTCIGCHTKAVAAGKTAAPTKCMDCHKKENGLSF